MVKNQEYNPFTTRTTTTTTTNKKNNNHSSSSSSSSLIYALFAQLFLNIILVFNSDKMSKDTRVYLGVFGIVLMGGTLVMIYRNGEEKTKKNYNKQTTVTDEERIKQIDIKLNHLKKAFDKSVGKQVDLIREEILKLVDERQKLMLQRKHTLAKFTEIQQKKDALGGVAELPGNPEDYPSAQQIAYPVEGFDNLPPVQTNHGPYIETFEPVPTYPWQQN